MGVPLLLNAIQSSIAQNANKEEEQKLDNLSSRQRHQIKKQGWYQRKRETAFEIRRTEHEKKEQAQSSAKEKEKVTKQRQRNVKINEDIDSILKDIGPHPVFVNFPLPVKSKGKLRSLDSFLSFSKVMYSLEVLTHSTDFTHVQFIDSRGKRVFLSIDDLTAMKFAYVDALISFYVWSCFL